MSKSEKLIIILPALGDMVPFAYLFIMPVWRTAPVLVVELCSFASLVIGSFVIVALIIMRQRKVIRKGSASAPIALVLALVGILEPIFYWI